jgi:hypothetical protein
MFWLRTNASHEQKPDLYIGKILNELNLNIEEDRPQRTRDRFEKAMNRLASDNLLTWRYKEEYTPAPRKWFSTWLQQQIVVEDPPNLKNQYMSIETAAKGIRLEEKVSQRKRRKTKGNKDEI